MRGIAVKVIELLVLLYLTYLGVLMVQEEVLAYPAWQTSIGLKIPFTVPRLGIFLGFLLMTIFHGALFARSREGGTKEPRRQRTIIGGEVSPWSLLAA